MRSKFILVVVSFMALVACRTGQVVVNQYYLLEYPATEVTTLSEGLHTLGGICEVADVKVAPAFSSHQMALRENSHQIRYLSYNEWAVRPSLLFTGMLMDFLDKNRMFEEITHGRYALPSKYLLETEIVHLELDMRSTTPLARLQVVFRISENGGDVVLSHNADRDEPLSGYDLNEFASVISRIFAEELHAFHRELSGRLPLAN